MRMIDNDLIHEQLLNQTPKLAFNENSNYEEWKEKVREKFVEVLGIDNIAKNACEIKVEVEETVEFDEHTRIRYVFESEKGCLVPCYLLIPKQGKEKYPVCICLQGHTTGFHVSIGKKIYDEDEETLPSHSYALDAVKNGFVALCVEQRGMGERTTLRQDRGRALTCGCYFTSMTALILGRTILGERVWDVSKAIDSLDFFKDKLDLDDITVIGQSGGGTATYYSACYDERIKMAVPSCSICSFKYSIAELWHCTCNYVPHSAEYFDMGELACLIAPRKLMVCNGDEDHIFPFEGTKVVCKVIDKIYKKENAEQNYKQVVFKGKKHYFDKEVVFKSLNELRNS